ncbi:hypothetical protein [Methylobacterium platani]|uniref:Secreted protein n=2 Tax=Methylobacterium platani TaxID=427683 RepID=A0A179S9E5_9HYPH|nr:hypothetical protein [Methylobacterium platani]KMO22326.1 hypothetical protein SQ03_00990 [Methylobacterium platani JCM 14648]OAS22532.1 hypothetical protein A5481_19250 [Methylobacterium platani]
MIATRILAAVLAVLATVPAEAARQAKPAPEPPPFPQHDDRFVMAVRGPVVGGRAGFARVYASPAGRDGWTTTVTCGTVDVRTGRERIELQAPGNAYRDRTSFTGTWTPLGGGGRYGENQMRTWSVTRQDGLDVTVAMSGPCPSGAGDVSSGD